MKPFVEKNTILRRLELSQRVSGGKDRAIGFVRTVSEDGDRVYGEGDVVIADYDSEKNTLKLTDSNFGYEDETLDGVTYVPISRGVESIFHVDDKDELVVDQTIYTYLVDPNTLQKDLKSRHQVTNTQVAGIPNLFVK